MSAGAHSPEAAFKARILVDALPYIRRFWEQVIVVKYGGNALVGTAGTTGGVGTAGAPGSVGTAGTPGSVGTAGTTGGVGTAGFAGFAPDTPETADPDGRTSEMNALASFAEDIVLMRTVGMNPLVVHGGGPQIGELMARLGKVPEFRGGLRVTDAETLDIARMVLVGKVNRDIVSAINVHAPIAVGVSGEDAGLILASQRSPELGYVGDVAAVNPSILKKLLAQNLIPVVATIGSDEAGQAYNINADTAAAAIAESLGAAKLIYLTDVEGLRRDKDDPSTLISTVAADALAPLLRDGTVSDGMIPKAAACLHAVRGGVGLAHILDGRVAHALLLELFTNEGVGTMVTP